MNLFYLDKKMRYGRSAYTCNNDSPMIWRKDPIPFIECGPTEHAKRLLKNLLSHVSDDWGLLLLTHVFLTWWHVCRRANSRPRGKERFWSGQLNSYFNLTSELAIVSRGRNDLGCRFSLPRLQGLYTKRRLLTGVLMMCNSVHECECVSDQRKIYGA